MLYFIAIILLQFDLFLPSKSQLYSRSDQEAEIYSKEGYVGTSKAPWYPSEAYGVYCPEGTWAIGIEFKSHGSQGNFKDDTAGNAVRLKCSSPNDWNIDTTTIQTNSPKNWGSWYAEECPTSGTFLQAFKTRVQGYQGIATDDTTLNCIEFECSDSIGIKPSDCRTKGSWSNSLSYCPSGSYICGLAEQFETEEFGDDETGMNAVRFYCCGFTESPTLSPTRNPTIAPTHSPTESTDHPTYDPTDNPSNDPTVEPSTAPTKAPTDDPTKAPTDNPTNATNDPTKAPTDNPTEAPTENPNIPTNAPTSYPTDRPSAHPVIEGTTAIEEMSTEIGAAKEGDESKDGISNHLLTILIALVSALICGLITCAVICACCSKKLLKEVRNANKDDSAPVVAQRPSLVPLQEGNTAQMDCVTVAGAAGTATDTNKGEFDAVLPMDDD